jgi:hypothetical protein
VNVDDLSQSHDHLFMKCGESLKRRKDAIQGHSKLPFNNARDLRVLLAEILSVKFKAVLLNVALLLRSLPIMDKPTPLINSSMMTEYAGQVVKIVGKVQRVRIFYYSRRLAQL